VYRKEILLFIDYLALLWLNMNTNTNAEKGTKNPQLNYIYNQNRHIHRTNIMKYNICTRFCYCTK